MGALSPILYLAKLTAAARYNAADSIPIMIAHLVPEADRRVAAEMECSHIAIKDADRSGIETAAALDYNGTPPPNCIAAIPVWCIAAILSPAKFPSAAYRAERLTYEQKQLQMQHFPRN